LDRIELHPDFKDFLRSLNATGTDYLLIGGYAVNVHGYSRVTDDLDVWIATTPSNAARVVSALRSFGFDLPALTPELFLAPKKITRLGRAPIRIEICNEISGVSYDDCRERAVAIEVGDMTIPVISLPDLRRNKAASGRPKDLLDLEHLPEEAKD